MEGVLCSPRQPVVRGGAPVPTQGRHHGNPPPYSPTGCLWVHNIGPKGVWHASGVPPWAPKAPKTWGHTNRCPHCQHMLVAMPTRVVVAVWALLENNAFGAMHTDPGWLSWVMGGHYGHTCGPIGSTHNTYGAHNHCNAPTGTLLQPPKW